MREHGIAADQIAQALASDSTDRQTWPRNRVRRWLQGQITVSASGAFAAGAALSRIGAKVSGPEAVVAAGHIPGYITLLEYIAAEPDGASSAARLAILPWAAYAFGTGGPHGVTVTGKASTQMLPRSHEAWKELRETQWPSAVFDRACKRWEHRKPLDRRDGSNAFDDAIDYAFTAAAAPALEPDLARDVAFPFIAEWVAGLPVAVDERERLLGYADVFEEFRQALRANFRRSFVHSLTHAEVMA